MSTQPKNNLVPALRFPQFANADAWQSVRLGEVCEFLDNKRIPIKEADRAKMQGVYPYYGASGIIDYVNDYIFDGDFILLGEDGANIISRSTPLAFRVSGKIWVNNHAHILKCKDENDIDMICNILESLDYSSLNTGTAQPKLNRDKCENITFPLPTLPEQQKIASCLSSLDEYISLTKKKLDLLKLHKKGLLQNLFPKNGESKPKFRFPGFEDEWKVVKLGDIFTERVEKGCCDLPLLSLTEADGIIPQEDTNRINNSNADKSKYLRICIGDIVYNTMRMWQGRCAFVTMEGIVSPAYTVCKPNSGTDGLFFSYYFKKTQVVNMFHRNSQGLVADTLNLKFENFKTIKILIPTTIVEQRKIASCLSSVDAEIEKYQKRLGLLNDHKKGLMQKLFPKIG